MNMEIFLDVDGVILDFEKSFINMIREEYKPELPLDFVPKTWELTDALGDIDIEKAWDKFVTSERMENLDPLVTAEQFNQLSSQAPVYLVTNIPQNLFNKRAKNLEKAGFNYTELFMAGHINFGDNTYPSKSEVIQKIRNPDKDLVFMDDHPRNCDDVKSRFPDSQVFLMNRPHNEDLEIQNEWIRVDHWDAFLNQVL